MDEAMNPKSPNNMKTRDSPFCMGPSFKNVETCLFLFDRNIRFGNKLLTDRRQRELSACLSQRVRLPFGQEQDRAPEWIAAVFDGGDLWFDLVDGQESFGNAA